ncbi:GATOR complex protein NPRL3 [Anastrepha ludens]|uniref:GATOR complex protein NPRL3 n=1 Tax=Anastrepha ludens TaxID=28586 RepID=UPI0023AF1F3A|nr:GATOR complex protein NPRL3 [Anastrepha ludens]
MKSQLLYDFNHFPPKLKEMEVNPIALMFVYMDSKGDRLLFRYPYENVYKDKPQLHGMSLAASAPVLNNPPLVDIAMSSSATSLVSQVSSETSRKRNPYAISSSDELLQTVPPPNITPTTVFGVCNNLCNTAPKGQLEGFTDEVLSTLFAVKQQLCNQKLELKVNDVRFVSHPTLIPRNEQRSSGGSNASNSVSAAPTSMPIAVSSGVPSGGATTNVTLTLPQPKSQPQQMLINIVFALHAQASYSIVKCYYELSKRLGLALRVEEQRAGYCTEETMLMARTHDELSSQQLPLERTFDAIAERSTLAQALKSIYHDLCTTGLLNTTLNQYLTVSFCLPQKAHQLHKKGSMVDPEAIDRCLRSLKPYHGMLLVDYAELLDCVPPRAARMLLQLVEIYTPLMSLQMLASEADMSIEHVYKMVSHLVYWGKATIIYPLCETNVYVIAPDAPLHTKSHLVEKFSARFAGMSLFDAISHFSLPTSIGHLTTPLQQSARQGMLAQMVVWMLQHHLLMQLHTYVQFMPSDVDDFYGGVSSMNVAASDCSVCSDGVHEHKSSLMDLQEGTNTISSLGVGATGELMISPMSRSMNVSDDDLNAGSLLSCASQPLPVPHTSHRSITEDRYSGGCSTASDNIVAQPSSSHKSNFSMTASMSTENCDSIASIEDEEKIKELLSVFSEADRTAIRRIPASTNVDDLSLLVKLYQAGYFKSEHHLEEIMYFQSLRPAELLQLLDKFRDVLIIYETEDPAIASMYNNK